MIAKGACDKGFVWNLSNCECQCDKSSDVGEYLDYEKCKCRKKLADKLVEECPEIVKEVKLTEHENKHKCISRTLYIVLFSIFFTNNVGIATYFVYSYWYLKKDVTVIRLGTNTQTTIY